EGHATGFWGGIVAYVAATFAAAKGASAKSGVPQVKGGKGTTESNTMHPPRAQSTPAPAETPTPTAGQKVYRVYGGDAKAEGASWTPERPSGNFREAAGLPSGGPSGASNSGQFVVEGTLQDPSAVVKIRRALPLDGNRGGAIEYVIPNPIESGAVRVDHV